MEGCYVNMAAFCLGFVYRREDGLAQASGLLTDLPMDFDELPTGRLAEPVRKVVQLALGLSRAGAYPETVRLALHQVEPEALLIHQEERRFGDAAASYISLRVSLPFREDGLHWYDLTIDGTPAARLVLAVYFRRRVDAPARHPDAPGQL